MTLVDGERLGGDGERLGGYCLASEIRTRHFGDTLVLLDLERELSFSVNEVGALTLGELGAGKSVEDAALRVASAYGVAPSSVIGDVERFVAELIAEGVLVLTTADSSRL